MPKVYNKNHARIPESAIYVGRPTVFGNPFSHMDGTTAQFKVRNREQAVASYEEWLLVQPELVARVKRELRGHDLICWCAPLSCHGDV